MRASRGCAMGAPKDFKKGKNEKNMGYFHASKLLKLAFLSSLTRKYVLWKGFYHNFSTKKASAPRGIAPWTPEVPSPPNDLPWCRPCARALRSGVHKLPGARLRAPVGFKGNGWGSRKLLCFSLQQQYFQRKHIYLR